MDGNNSSSEASEDVKREISDSLEESEAEKEESEVIECERYSVSFGVIPDDEYLSKRDSVELYTLPIHLYGEQEDDSGTIVRLRALWDQSRDSKEEEEYIVMVSSKTGFSIRQVFSLLDVRKENSMTFNDFKTGLKKIGFERPDSDIKGIFTSMDSEGARSIDEETFVEWVNSSAKKEPSMLKQELLQTGAQAVEDYKNLKKHRQSVQKPPEEKKQSKTKAKTEEEKMLEMMAEYKQLHRMDTRTFKIFRQRDQNAWTRADMLDLAKEMREEMKRQATSTPTSTSSPHIFGRAASSTVDSKTARKASFFHSSSLKGSIGAWRAQRKNSLPRNQAGPQTPVNRKRSSSTGFGRPKRTRSGSLGSSITNIFSWKPKKTPGRAESPAVIPSALFFSRAQQDDIKRHLRSILQSGSVRVKHVRLMIMGPPQCGKTALWRSLNDEKSYRDMPTPGIMKRVLNISKGAPVSTKLIPLQDTLARMIVRRLRVQNKHEGSSPRSKIGDSELPKGLHMPTLLDWDLIRNYCDVSDEELEDPDTICYDCYEYSGLRQYWVMYHHFVSRSGVLLMVLSCRHMVDVERRKSTLLYFEQVFALVSRVARGTPIMIVATNWEYAGPQRLTEINKLLISTLENYPAWEFVKHNDEKKLSFYTIDNQSQTHCRQSASNIRSVLTQITLKDGGDRIMPFEWFQVYNWILRERKCGTKSVLKLSDIHAKFPHAGELEGLLSILSDLGVVLYFRQWTFCNTFCIIQPNKFLSLLSTILRPPVVENLKCDFPPPSKFYRKLQRDGIFSLEMLQCFDSSFAGEYEFIKHILQRLGVVAPWNSQARYTLELSEFLIPSLITKTPSKAIIKRKAELTNLCHLLKVVINPAIPWGFRPRFLGRLVKLSVLTKEGSRKLLLSQQMSLITVGYDEFIIEMVDSTAATEASRSISIVAPFSTSAGRVLENIMKVSDLTVGEYAGTTYSIKLGKQEIDYMVSKKAKEDGTLDNRLAKWFDSSL